MKFVWSIIFRGHRLHFSNIIIFLPLNEDCFNADPDCETSHQGLQSTQFVNVLNSVLNSSEERVKSYHA